MIVFEHWGALAGFAVVVPRDDGAAERRVPVAFADGERATVRGVVVSTRVVDGFRGRPERKMTVKVTTEDGGVFLLYGTEPADLLGVAQGVAVTFTATIEHGNREPSFGFFKRPTGAQIG